MAADFEGPPPGVEALSAAAWFGLAEDLRLLALLHGQELTPAVIETLRRDPPQEWFTLVPTGADYEEGLALIERALAALPAPPDAQAIDDLAAEYAAIYLTHAYRAAPSESVWRDQEGLERQAPMFAVRELYRRHDLAVADWRVRSDDHIVNELAFLAELLQLAKPAALADAATFLRDHLLVWVPAFAGRVARRCRHPFYGGLALVTVAYLQGLATLLGEDTGIEMTPPVDEIVTAAFDGTRRPGGQGNHACGG